MFDAFCLLRVVCYLLFALVACCALLIACRLFLVDCFLLIGLCCVFVVRCSSRCVVHCFLCVCVFVWHFGVWCMVCDDVKLVLVVRGYPFDRFCFSFFFFFFFVCCVVVRWLLFVSFCSLVFFFVGCRRFVSCCW